MGVNDGDVTLPFIWISVCRDPAHLPSKRKSGENVKWERPSVSHKCNYFWHSASVVFLWCYTGITGGALANSFTKHKPVSKEKHVDKYAHLSFTQKIKQAVEEAGYEFKGKM